MNAADNALLDARTREAEIREHCVTRPIQLIQDMGLLLGLICDRSASEIRDALLKHDILTGISADPDVLRLRCHPWYCGQSMSGVWRPRSAT